MTNDPLYWKPVNNTDAIVQNENNIDDLFDKVLYNCKKVRELCEV